MTGARDTGGPEPSGTANGRDPIPRALFCDPPVDRAAPAETLAEAIPSGGVNLNAVLYTASGSGPHPTVLLLHGLPGNEQNLDLAQSIRRAGWNVLTLHYRGSWGSPGTFSFIHCLEDGAAAVNWLRQAGTGGAARIDRERIAVIGHSMGGFVAAHLVARDPALLGAGLLSGVGVGPVFGSSDKDRAVAIVDDNVGTSEGLHILSGTSPQALAAEAGQNAAEWCLEACAPKLSGRPLLVITSDDGFAAGSLALAEAVGRSGSEMLVTAHLQTDHSYSDHRIALQSEVLNWIESIDREIMRPARGGS